jgi:hypothetical protein
MTAHFSMHAGDTKHIDGILEDEIGPIDISGATEVRFVMWTHPDMVQVIDAPAVVDNPALGEVHYEWDQTVSATPLPKDVAGRYRGVFRAIYDDATPGQLSFPSDRYFLIEILP